MRVVTVSGARGSGKTTLIRYMLNKIDTDILPAVIFNTNLTSDQLISQILQLYGLEPEEGNKTKNLKALSEFLINQYETGSRALLIIDEAQNLTNEALEEIRMLSNIQSNNEMLLQIILVGQPELKARFKNPALAQFSQRIAVNYHLEALTKKEMMIYIVFRLKKAGGRPDIFKSDTMDMIYRASGGIPRTINLLCDSALVYGFADEVTEIDTQILEKVIEELGFIGLYDEKNFEFVSRKPVNEMAEGNGFLHRLEKLEEKIQQIQLQVDWQNAEIDRKINGPTKDLVARLKAHLQNERKRSAHLAEENARLKKKLRELEHLKAGFNKIVE